MATTKILFSIEQKKKDLFKLKAVSERKTITEVLVKFVDSYIGKGSPENNKQFEFSEKSEEFQKGLIPPKEEVSVISEKAENSAEVKTIPRANHSNKKPYPTFFKKV
jgi:hypothetical protein